jgi:hypothetical protein
MKKFLIFSALTFLLAGFPAHALSVKNVDHTSYKLIVTDGGEKKTVMLPPRGVYKTPGPFVTVELPGQKPISALRYSELMVKNGKLSLQRRPSHPFD